MYHEIKPSSELHHLIDSFWTYSNNEQPENFKVLPDTCIDLIVDLNQNQGFISGVMTKFQFRELAMKANLIGIRFKSEKFACLSQISLEETKNLRVELSELFHIWDLSKLVQLNHLETETDKIKLLENLIVTAFKDNYQRQDNMVLSIAENIRFLKGRVNINDIARSNHISLRQLERRFKKSIGLTVKEFSNIVRFTNAKKKIAKLPGTSLLEIAYDMGFFDHSHMTHEFKRISGENPSFFR